MNEQCAQPCGCDPGLRRNGIVIGHRCERHRIQEGVLGEVMPERRGTLSDAQRRVCDLIHREEKAILHGETRIVDPTTGGEKGSKLARFSLIPADFLWALAEHYGLGAKKYADRNWERGYKWSLTVDAMERHWNAWKMGEDNDPETGSSHLIAAAWHVVALWWFHKHGKGTDDVRVIQWNPLREAQVQENAKKAAAMAFEREKQRVVSEARGKQQGQIVTQMSGLSAEELRVNGFQEGTYRLVIEKESK